MIQEDVDDFVAKGADIVIGESFIPTLARPLILTTLTLALP